MITASEFYKWAEIFNLTGGGPSPPVTFPITLAQGGTGAELTAIENAFFYIQDSVGALLSTENNAVLATNESGVPVFSADITLHSLTLPTGGASEGLRIMDPLGNFGLTFVNGSSLDQERDIVFNVGNVNPTLTIEGHTTLNDWFDQSVKTTGSPTFNTITVTNIDPVDFNSTINIRGYFDTDLLSLIKISSFDDGLNSLVEVIGNATFQSNTVFNNQPAVFNAGLQTASIFSSSNLAITIANAENFFIRTADLTLKFNVSTSAVSSYVPFNVNTISPVSPNESISINGITVQDNGIFSDHLTGRIGSSADLLISAGASSRDIVFRLFNDTTPFDILTFDSTTFTSNFINNIDINGLLKVNTWTSRAGGQELTIRTDDSEPNLDGIFFDIWKQDGTAQESMIHIRRGTMEDAVNRTIIHAGIFPTGLMTNLIDDVTDGTGVTIDGFLIKDSNVTWQTGSYSPILSDGTNNFTMTGNFGFYQSVGQLRQLQFSLSWSSKGSASGNIRLSLPFSMVNATGRKAIVTLGYCAGINITSGWLVAEVEPSGLNYIDFYVNKADGSTPVNVTAAMCAASGSLAGSLWAVV